MAMRVRGGCVCVDVDVDIGEYCYPLTIGGSTLGQICVSRRISYLGANMVIPLMFPRHRTRQSNCWLLAGSTWCIPRAANSGCEQPTKRGLALT